MKKPVRSSSHVLRVCISFSFLMFFTLSVFKLQAQQNPYPFSLDLSFGGGMIGNPDVNTTFQPELGFSYMPGKFGVGLNAGLLSYDPAFDGQQYAAGFEDYTSVSGSDEKWSSFFLSLGPRFEFGSSLPVTFRSSLDLSLSYNSPPSMSVDFDDPDGSAGDLQLQLSGYDAGDDYSKWSAAIRPEFQMQFNPGGSDRFAITVATGIQHRLSQNEFTYSQRDLSEVRVVPNSQEMFMQFEMAPEVQQTAQPPKTNFFTTVGLKIKFGSPKGMSAPAQDYNSSRSNKPSSIANNGDDDCNDGDVCTKPGEVAPNDPDSDGDGIDDGVKLEKVAEARDKVENIMEALDKCDEGVCGQVRQNADKRYSSLSRALENPEEMNGHIAQVHSIVMEDVVSLSKCGMGVCKEVLAMEQNLLAHMNDLMGVVQATRAQDYNAARSNKPTSRAEDVGDQDADSDDDGIDDAIETEQDHRSTKALKKGDRLNTEISDGDADSDGDGIDDAIETAQETRGIDKKDIRRGEVNSDDCDDAGPCPHPGDTMAKAKELGLASVGNDISTIKQVLDRCDEGVCGQVRQHADERHHGVARAQENPTEIDTHIEEILNIVKKDVESLGKCETDECREALAMEEKLLVKMNRLNDLAQIAPAQDYNSSRSNKPSSRAADIGDGDMDSDDDGIDDADTRKVRLARLANPTGLIVKTGMVAAGGNPLYQGNTSEGENPLYEGQANDGDSDNTDNEDPLPSQRYDMQPSSYCVELGSNALQGKSTETQDYNATRSNKPTSRATDTGEGDLDSDDDGIDDAIEMAQDYNSSRSNKPNTIADIGDVDGDGFPDLLKNASFSISKRSARTGRSQSPIHEGGDLDGDGFGDAAGLQFDLEIGDPDSDEDGFTSSINTDQVLKTFFQTGDKPTASATYSISKRSARTGRSQSPIYEGDGNNGTNPMYQSDEMASGNGGDVEVLHFDLEIGDLRSEASKEEPSTRSDSSSNASPGLQVAPSQTKVIVLGVTDNGDIIPLNESRLRDIELSQDPDSDDDGLMDAIESAAYSISKRSARTGRSSQDSPQQEMTSPNNVYKWTYKLSALSGGEDLPGNGTLNVVFTGGSWHFDLEVDPVDPDDDGDGFGDLLQSSSFSISKRSARTGRNR